MSAFAGVTLAANSAPDGAPATVVVAPAVGPSCAYLGPTSARIYPSLEVGCGHTLAYLGTYASDGKFRQPSRVSDLKEDSNTEWTEAPTLRPDSVPANVDLHPRERMVENYAVHVHQTKVATGRSHLADWRDNLITFAYGRERTIVAPRFLTTDSRGRVIVSDPAAGVVHVLDKQNSFRIAAGKNYRLRSAGAVAVDGDDNIYVADREIGLVLVFDPNGKFLREFGRINQDEGIFHDPVALAIDRQTSRLIVVDASREMLLVLDLDGKVLQRVGGRRQESGVALHGPTAIAVKHDQIVVVDEQGAHIQILDRKFQVQHQFDTGLPAGYSPDLGVDVDSDGHIYLSNIDGARIRIYDHSGRLEAVFGRAGHLRGEFASPAAVWIDAQNRLYVAENQSRRVQVFQLETTKGH